MYMYLFIRIVTNRYWKYNY